MLLSPGHACELHQLLSRATPRQGFPPKLGAGRVQRLERSRKPVPHDLLQALHALQVDQPPSTVRMLRKVRKTRWLSTTSNFEFCSNLESCDFEVHVLVNKIVQNTTNENGTIVFQRC